jgi:aminopeptidase YwaD
MTRSASGFFRMSALPLCLLTAGLVLTGGPAPAAAAVASQPEKTPDQVRAERARNRLGENTPALERAAEAPRELPPLDPALVEFYRSTVIELADPAYEGRAPGSAGIERAAVYIEEHFKALGLQPAFATSELAADGTEVLTPRTTFRQPFGVGQETRAGAAAMTVDGQAVEPDTDFSVLAYSGSGEVTAPVAFAGYAIVSGPAGYLGFDPNTRFEDKVVLALAYEPMNDDGTSQWQEEGFSHHAQMTHKASALIRRGAKAVLIVKPPHAVDERVDVLESIDSTRTSRPGLNARALRFDAPVVQITPELAQRILDRAGDPDLTLASLVEQANAGAVAADLPGEPISLQVTMETVSTETFNVGAVLPGVGNLGDEYIVIGAHYDHVGYGSTGAMPGNAGELHPGADDNASGTTGMMLVAKTVAERVRALPPNQPRRSVLFLAFSAEEMGLLGSLHYTKEPIVPSSRHALMLNLDMIGTLENEPLEIGNIRSSQDLPALVDPHFERSGLVIARETSVGNGRSDHASFDAVGVPNLFFFTGLHPRYHRPQDTGDTIDSEGGARIALMVADIAMDAAARTEPIVHRRAAAGTDPAAGQPTVRIGLLPANSTKGGILVQRVFPDTSASDAGIEPNDRLLTWNGKDLRSVEDLRPRLVEHKPGDVVRVTLERGDQTIEVDLTLRAIE